MAEAKRKEEGFSVAYCAVWVGIGLAVFGVAYAVLEYAGFEAPFGVAALGMVAAAGSYQTLVALWSLVRSFKMLNVLLLAGCAALAAYFSVSSIVIPVAHRAPGAPLITVLGTALVHSPTGIFLVAAIALAVALALPHKPSTPISPPKH